MEAQDPLMHNSTLNLVSKATYCSNSQKKKLLTTLLIVPVLNRLKKAPKHKPINLSLQG